MSVFDSIVSRVGRALFPPAPVLSLDNVARAIEPVADWDDDMVTYQSGDDYSESVLRSLVSEMERKGGSAAAQLLLGSLRSTQPPKKGTQEMLAAMRHMPHLRSVVGRVSSSVAAVRWRVFKVPRARALNTPKSRFTKSVRDGDGLTERMTMIKEAVETGDLVEVPDHLMARLIQKPNPEQTGIAARKLAQTHLETIGEGIFLREDNVAGIPVELWPVPPHWVKDIPRPGHDFFDIQWNGPRVLVPADRVWYMRDLDAERPYGRGSGIGAAVSDDLDVDEFAAKHMKSWFLNHAIPSMLVGLGETGDDEVDVAAQKWRERNQGPNRRNRVHFHNGTLSAVRLDDKFSDMEIVDVRKYQAAITRETWNVPPEVLGHVENSNLATIEEAINILGMLVVVPRLEFWFGEINEVLARWFPDGDRVIAVYDNPIRPNMKQVLDAAAKAPQVPSVNDWRKWMSLPPVQGGSDLHVVNGVFAKWDPEGSPEPTIVPPNGGPPKVDPKKPKPKKEAPVVVAKVITEASVGEALGVLSVDVAIAETNPVMVRLLEGFGADALRTIGIGVSFNMFNPTVVDFLAAYAGNQIKGINDTTRQLLREELIQGVAAGEGIGPLSRRVRSVFAQANKTRATLIARTEVNSASNFARWAGYVQVGEDVVPAKKWITTADNRARSAHVGIHGQLQKMLAPFVCQGHKAQHPGAFNVAALDCNCRCVLVPVMALNDDGTEKSPRTSELEDAIWRSYDREVALWEGALADAWRKVFAVQQHAVLRSLERLA